MATRALPPTTFPVDLFPPRDAIAAAVETLVAVLDVLDGDPEAEDDTEDRCPAGDDDVDGRHTAAGCGPGDPDDAEDGDEDRCLAGDDGIFAGPAGPAPWPDDPRFDEDCEQEEGCVPLTYGVDQTRPIGPNNPEWTGTAL